MELQPRNDLRVSDADRERSVAQLSDHLATGRLTLDEFSDRARIDERATVFVMGRTAFVFLSDGTLDPAAFRAGAGFHEVASDACNPDPGDRFGSVAEFHDACRDAAGHA